MFDLKCKTEIHNYFEVEVIRNGNTIQKGYGQNIILDRFFENIGVLPNYIHVGDGTGTLNPSNTALFHPLGSYSGTSQEQWQDYDNGIYTKVCQATVPAGSLTGKVITEVGLGGYYTHNSLRTHAFLKDSEGNPLTITKTALDELKITATVFYNMNFPSGFYIPRGDLGNILGGQMPDVHFLISSFYFHSYGDISDRPDYAFTKTQTNQTVSNYLRIGTNTQNKEIRGMLSGGVFIKIDELSNFSGVTLENKELGVGDASKTEFQIPNTEPKSIEIYKNGTLVQSSDYTITLVENYVQDLSYLTTTLSQMEQGLWSYRRMSIRAICFKPDAKLLLLKIFPSSYYGVKFAVFLLKINDDSLPAVVDYIAKDTNSHTLDVYGELETIKIDGEYYNVQNESFVSCTADEVASSDPCVSNITNNSFIRSKFKAENNSLYTNFAYTKITFNTPPAQDEVISANYHVDYIPKDSDHILDITVNFDFSAGQGS